MSHSRGLSIPTALSAGLAIGLTLGSVVQAADAIQDNSFLIEEAYNQEAGIVQHITTLDMRGDGWTLAFTQEWPAGGLKHQLSYTLGLQHAGEGLGTGFSDAALNYRCQLVGNGRARLALAPRLSLLFPTGDESKQRGAGGLGLQLNLPLSWQPSDQLVAHANAGVTHTPQARNESGDEAAASTVNLGGSFVWLAGHHFNLMAELLWTRGQRVTGPSQAGWGSSLILNPGLRCAIDFKSGLQIVPGLARPIGLGPSRGERGIFVYLSFEHPLRRRATAG